MTAHVLISGQFFRAPEQRTSKAGKPFVTATIRVKDGEAAQWWKVLAFSESAQAELMRLADSDALSVQGQLKVETYEKDGVTKLSLSLVASSRCVSLARKPMLTSSRGREYPSMTPCRFRRPGMSARLIRSLPHLERLAWP